ESLLQKTRAALRPVVFLPRSEPVAHIAAHGAQFPVATIQPLPAAPGDIGLVAEVLAVEAEIPAAPGVADHGVVQRHRINLRRPVGAGDRAGVTRAETKAQAIGHLVAAPHRRQIFRDRRQAIAAAVLYGIT